MHQLQWLPPMNTVSAKPHSAHGMALLRSNLRERLPSTKQEVQMIETSCTNDLKAQELHPNISDEELMKRRRLHCRACGYYWLAKGEVEYVLEPPSLPGERVNPFASH